MSRSRSPLARSQRRHRDADGHEARLGQPGLVQRHHVGGEEARLAFVHRLRAALDEHDHVVGQAGGHLLVGLGEDQHLRAALEVLEGEARHAVALLGLDEAQPDDDPAHRDLALGQLRQLARGGGGHLRQLGLEALEGVAGDEEAERLLLVGQPLAFRPVGEVAHPLRRRVGLRRAAARAARAGSTGPVVAVALPLLPDVHRPVEGVQQRGPPPVEAVEAAALDEALHHAPVDRAQVDPLAEVEQRAEGLAAPPHLQHRLHRALAHVLDRGQPEADGVADVAANDREVDVRLVHVRRQHLDPHGAALADVAHHAVGVRALRGEERGHEVRGMVRLQVRGLVGQPRVGRGVRLVEAVARELLHVVPDLAGLLLRDPALDAALQELVLLGGHDVGLLLPHRLAQDVGLAERVAGQGGGDLHDLLLVDHDAVGPGQDRLQQRVVVGRPWSARAGA